MNGRSLGQLVLLVVLSLFIVNSYGQDIKIVNSSNSKIIKKTDIVEVAIGEENLNKQNKFCDFKVLRGQVVSVNKDTILMNVTELRINSRMNDVSKELIFKWGDRVTQKSILNTEILYLTKYKSNREDKIRKALSITGGILVLGGVITTINTLIGVNKGSRKNLLVLGGIEIGAGFIIGMSSVKKEYKFKNTKDPWRFLE